MGSLNGDIMVMRNGRSTSQVSVYNYPEHLNPFYEDDQHKRLRFWKISKKDNEGRRNSFSIANLKDMWAFKSFRMKKKSSTLGVNKTSESPPLLRRDYALDNDGWNTFDNRLRASNTSSINGDNFQRNAIYRSSLQTLPISNDRMGLNRNDGYRSTIQVPRSNPRFQPQQKQHLQSNSGVSHNRRSSQSSMVSTNPFESEDDDETEEFKAGMRSILNGSITTLTSRTPRKKRRAPAPPTPIHGSSNGVPLPTIRIDSSPDNNTQDELHIKEDMDIANLTAEIESFVKTKSNDDVEEHPPEKCKTTVTITTDNSKIDTNLKVAEEKQQQNVTHTAVILTEDIAHACEEIINTTEKATDHQVTTETVTVSADTKIKSDVIEPEKNATSLTRVSAEVKAKAEEKKEIKTNGAIPKKPNNSSEEQSNPSVEELCIRETGAEEMPSKPVPLKRQTKPDVEVGQVECIHVHVESPKASPRKDHASSMTSFKATETVESTQSITTKTPFVLTSPPTQRRKQQQTDSVEPVKKETVKIVEPPYAKSTVTSELNIQEERIHTKPEVLVKPTLSPKPVTKDIHGKMQGYADIHKPMRRHNQNGQPTKSLREGSISPPFVPQHVTQNEEQKINNTDQCRTNGFIEEKSAAIKPLQFDASDSLKIIETTTKTNDGIKKEEPVEKYQEECANSNSVSVAALVSQEESTREDEFDSLYRPKPVSHMEWKRSTLAPLETNIPPEKRKSVKDIIESINRSQRLLNAAANKDFPALQKPQPALNHKNNNNLNEDLKFLNEQQAEFQCSVEKRATSSNRPDQAGAARSPSPSPSNDSNEIFQKCKVNKEVFDYRETSPITSNLDWNPVPKPKRTKAAQE